MLAFLVAWLGSVDALIPHQQHQQRRRRLTSAGATTAGVMSPSVEVVEKPLRVDASAAEQQVLPLRIEGEWYDASAYAASQHAGGRWLLEYARGRDVTQLFRAVHVLGERRARDHLTKLPRLLPQEADPFVFQEPQLSRTDAVTIDSPLRYELAEMLKRKFPKGTLKATPLHWARIAVLTVATAWCWQGWSQGEVGPTVVLPLIHWLLAAHTAHDATHGSLSSRPWVNYVAQFTGHPIFFNVFVWVPQHLLSHHQHTNDPGFDSDQHHFAPARLSRRTPREFYPKADLDKDYGPTFVLKGMLSTLGTCLLQPARTLLQAKTPNFEKNITPVASTVDHRTLALSLLPSIAVLLVPLLKGHGLFFALWPFIGASMIWTTMTQVSHIQDFDFDDDSCWTQRQIETSLDYSVHDRQQHRLVSILSAGLNAQGLHHALPSVSQCHLADIYEEYAEIVDRHGASRRTSRNLLTAATECLTFVFEINKGDETRRTDANQTAYEY